ncbi:MAG: hypothetical protein AB2556_26165 [Candidatus Thiodiazotropha sp.]
MPKEQLSQGTIDVLNNALVPMDVNLTAPNLDRVLCQQRADRAHELTAGANLEQFGPPQWASPVDARQSFSNLFGFFCDQRLSLFVA